MFLSNDFYNFLYIAVIILSGITFSLTLILSAREKDEKHKALYLFTAAVFVFMIIDSPITGYLIISTCQLLRSHALFIFFKYSTPIPRSSD